MLRSFVRLSCVVGLTVIESTIAMAADAATVKCASQADKRQHCAADVSGGVALHRTTSSAACLLGHTWGYDDNGVWVEGGCAAEFTLGESVKGDATVPAAASTDEKQETDQGKVGTWHDTWGVYDPGDGFLVGRNEFGELDISAYAMGRVMDQNDSDKLFVDHLGNTRAVDPRLDIFS